MKIFTVIRLIVGVVQALIRIWPKLTAIGKQEKDPKVRIQKQNQLFLQSIKHLDGYRELTRKKQKTQTSSSRSSRAPSSNSNRNLKPKIKEVPWQFDQAAQKETLKKRRAMRKHYKELENPSGYEDYPLLHELLK